MSEVISIDMDSEVIEKFTRIANEKNKSTDDLLKNILIDYISNFE